MPCALVLGAAVWFATAAAQAGPSVRVFAIRGVAGVRFSRAMNVLCDELAELASVTCRSRISLRLTALSRRRAPRTPLAHSLVGHSMGAAAAIQIASEIPRPVAVIDPPRARVRPVPDNVAVVIHYCQQTDIFGRGVVSTAPGFKGRITRIRRDEPHIVMDRDPEIHAAIMAEIVRLLP